MRISTLDGRTDKALQIMDELSTEENMAVLKEAMEAIGAMIKTLVEILLFNSLDALIRFFTQGDMAFEDLIVESLGLKPFKALYEKFTASTNDPHLLSLGQQTYEKMLSHYHAQEL
jgi:hypothetical protein